LEQLTQLIQHKQWDKVFCSDPAIQQMLHKHHFTQFTDTNLADCNVSVTSCESLVARTGTIVLSNNSGGRTSSVYAPVHICVAYTNQLVFDIADAITQLQQKYNHQLPSLISFATGPSRTADIEKTLVVGVHGPKEVFCFLIEN
jgi:L-lactate dehydrogenase complex protein LldG